MVLSTSALAALAGLGALGGGWYALSRSKDWWKGISTPYNFGNSSINNSNNSDNNNDDNNKKWRVPMMLPLAPALVSDVQHVGSDVSDNTNSGVSSNLLGSLGSGLGSLLNTGINGLVSYGLQKKQWEREDSAIQRRVNDLKAAGLNPRMAVGGSGAASSTPMLASFSPNLDQKYINQVSMASNILALQRAQIENAIAEKRLKWYDVNLFAKIFGK